MLDVCSSHFIRCSIRRLNFFWALGPGNREGEFCQSCGGWWVERIFELIQCSETTVEVETIPGIIHSLGPSIPIYRETEAQGIIPRYGSKILFLSFLPTMLISSNPRVAWGQSPSIFSDSPPSTTTTLTSLCSTTTPVRYSCPALASILNFLAGLLKFRTLERGKFSYGF